MSSSNIPAHFYRMPVETKRLTTAKNQSLADPPVTFVLRRVRVNEAPPSFHRGVPENLTVNIGARYLRDIATVRAVEKVISRVFIIRNRTFLRLFLPRFFVVWAVVSHVVRLVTLITSLGFLT